MSRADYVYCVVEVHTDGTSFNLGFYETNEEAQKVVSSFDTLKRAGSTFLDYLDYAWVEPIKNKSKPSNQTVEGVHD